MSQALSALQEQVAKNTSVIESARELIAGFGARLDAVAASASPDAALEQLRAELAGQDEALAQAVAANTGAPANPGGAIPSDSKPADPPQNDGSAPAA